jgi:hypothetical protein
VLALTIVLATLVAGSGAAAQPMRYGVADDWPEWHPCGDAWWAAAKDIGYQDLRLTVRWDDAQPAVIPSEANIQAAVGCASLAGLRPILAVYPLTPSAFGSSAAAQRQFAAFVALVGTAFPQVTNFVVGNEPNLNRFWQPQYVNGRDAAAKDYEHTLAASYDALKAVLRSRRGGTTTRLQCRTRAIRPCGSSSAWATRTAPPAARARSSTSSISTRTRRCRTPRRSRNGSCGRGPVRPT